MTRSAGDKHLIPAGESKTFTRSFVKLPKQVIPGSLVPGYSLFNHVYHSGRICSGVDEELRSRAVYVAIEKRTSDVPFHRVLLLLLFETCLDGWPFGSSSRANFHSRRDGQLSLRNRIGSLPKKRRNVRRERDYTEVPIHPARNPSALRAGVVTRSISKSPSPILPVAVISHAIIRHR